MPKWLPWLSSMLHRRSHPHQPDGKHVSHRADESEIRWGGDLRKQIGRPFIERWLGNVAELCEKLPDNADPQIVSFMCQLNVAACLQESGLRANPNAADLDFGMEFVKTLWAVMPIGAKQRIKPDALAAMTLISRLDPISVWHNFQAS